MNLPLSTISAMQQVSRWRTSWPWYFAALLVLSGWVAGYAIWSQPDAGDFGSGVDVLFPLAMLAIGLPLIVVAGIVRGRDGTFAKWGGRVLLAVGALVLAYFASFAFFGGLCLDPGDVCVTTWPSRVANLATGMGILVLGWCIESRVWRRPPRRDIAPLTR